MYSTLSGTRYWIYTVIDYIRMYRKLAEVKATAAFCMGIILFFYCALVDRSWCTLCGSFLSFVLAKRLARGTWVESSLSSYSHHVRARNIVIVGASRGIGFYVSERFAKLGPKRLILGVRGDEKRVQSIVNVLQAQIESDKTKIIGFPCDLNDLQNVVRFVESIKSELGDEALDCLICNAGCLAPVDWRQHKLTPDGFEMSWQSNVLGHFVIIEDLIPLLMRSKQPRIIHMSSIAHTWTLQKIDYSLLTRTSTSASVHQPVMLYAWSKLAQIYHTQDLHERYGPQGLIACAVHPGIVRTTIHEKSVSPITGAGYKLWQYFTGKSVQEGAQPALFCALASNVIGGQWYHDCNHSAPSLVAQDLMERKKCIHWLTEARQSATPRSLGMRGERPVS